MAKKIWGGKKITEIIKDAKGKQNDLNFLFNKSQETVAGIDEIAKKVNEKFQSVSSEANEVGVVLDEVRSEKQEIQILKDEVSGLESAANELVKTNQTLVKEIKDQLAVVTGASLSNTFEGRRKILSSSATKWFWWLLGDILILVAVAAIIFLELKNTQSLTIGFFLKFSLSFPFIYAAVFFHSQYNKEKEIEEEYAFKSAVSFSFDAYRKILVEEINYEKPDEKIKLLDFVIDTIKNIYSPITGNTHPRKVNVESSNTLEKINKIIDNIVGLVKH